MGDPDYNPNPPVWLVVAAVVAIVGVVVVWAGLDWLYSAGCYELPK